jgi:hypothetical protein
MRVEGRKLFVNQQQERIPEKFEQEYKLESVNRTMSKFQSLTGPRLPRSSHWNALREPLILLLYLEYVYRVR